MIDIKADMKYFPATLEMIIIVKILSSPRNGQNQAHCLIGCNSASLGYEFQWQGQCPSLTLRADERVRSSKSLRTEEFRSACRGPHEGEFHSRRQELGIAGHRPLSASLSFSVLDAPRPLFSS